MTLARLACITLAFAAGCASRSHAISPATPRTPVPAAKQYRLCTDPQFDCVPAELQPTRVDTNLVSPMPWRSVG